MIRAIAACTHGRVIGRDNQIPWHHPEDMRHFREMTAGQTVIMGRRTWDSLSERFRPLPGRKNLVMTRRAGAEARKLKKAGAVVCRQMSDVSQEVGAGDAWVMGGSEIYQLFWPMLQEIHLTLVPDKVPDGDAIFPHMSRRVWYCANERRHKGLIFRVFRRVEDLEELP